MANNLQTFRANIQNYAVESFRWFRENLPFNFVSRRQTRNARARQRLLNHRNGHNPTNQELPPLTVYDYILIVILLQPVTALCVYATEVFNFIILFVIFHYSNVVIIWQVFYQHERNLTALYRLVFCIFCVIFFFGYKLQDNNVLSNLILIPSYTEPLNMWNLIKVVATTDVLLKLITILFKTFIIAMSDQQLPYEERGKYYLLTEATSQLYRSIVPIKPCLHYFLEFYQDPEKVASVILIVAYVVYKGYNLMVRVKLFKTSVYKIFHIVRLGSSPNKKQLQRAGSQCPVCKEDFKTPILLQCKHIFCQSCVSAWFDTQSTCPLCRKEVVADDLSWRDGSSTYYIQF